MIMIVKKKKNIFMERNSNYVKIWSSKNEHLIFKSQRLFDILNYIKS